MACEQLGTNTELAAASSASCSDGQFCKLNTLPSSASWQAFFGPAVGRTDAAVTPAIITYALP
jgi:hypothetical protein